MLIFEHLYPNLWDIGENLHIFRAISIIRILSISVSSWSIISPIITRQTILAFINGSVASELSTLIKCIQIFVHLSISTTIVLLFRFDSIYYTVLYRIDAVLGGWWFLCGKRFQKIIWLIALFIYWKKLRRPRKFIFSVYRGFLW